MKPLVTNIQKYSIHDGDGIRTSVFFKGCPLKCMWCHNPETQNFNKQVLTNREKCVVCRTCEKACPNGAIRLEDGKMVTDRVLCEACGTCTEYCLLNIREIAGKEYEVKELVKELKKDLMFYEQSGGGVTLSGGEVMCMNMDYIEALVKTLDHQGITVTIDTCGYAPYENFKRILPYVNTFLYDIKAIDNEVHKRFVGVDNSLILENLEKLSEDQGRIYIRIPTIKGVNADDMSMQAVIDWLKTHNINVAQVNLLPYHNTGSSKYGRLETEYEGQFLSTPDKEEMQHFMEMFQKAGFNNTKIGG
ncbi:trans-4-hydroxy-L-proline dehydratase activase [Sporofaciens sp. SGI.106]|uniref:trans-4-hydroxy-L-proline dehydratase activase n=1 Tax=Sporofaciens sp. SGI.106 TaxID=3420568 RepID=UPI002A9AA761|nr:trans-4-hydroxy-L-proline dehydratase activase [Lachnoclostridium sp.]